MTQAKFNLDVIDVPEPCPEPWEGMTGDDRARFCGTCREDVYDLSAMTRADAEALIVDKHGSLCVRFYRRADGTVSTIDCAPVRFARLRKAARRSLSGAAALFVGLMGLITSLGLLRLSGFDLGAYFEDTAIGALAKTVEAHAPVVAPAPATPLGPRAFEEGDLRYIGGFMGAPLPDRSNLAWIDEVNEERRRARRARRGRGARSER